MPTSGKIRVSTAVGLAAAALAGCVAHTRPENAAVQMPWPREAPPALMAYSPPDRDYPSVGGDVLKGASPADQEAARAAARRASAIDGQP
jgi:hypothetical protein